MTQSFEWWVCMWRSSFNVRSFVAGYRLAGCRLSEWTWNMRICNLQLRSFHLAQRRQRQRGCHGRGRLRAEDAAAKCHRRDAGRRGGGDLSLREAPLRADEEAERRDL